jgi:Zn-dependent protease with chaperone function
MNFLQVLAAYFTSQPIAAILGMLYASLILLFTLFKLERHHPQRRLRILFGFIVTNVFTWTFLASSLLLCGAFLGLYQNGLDLDAVRTVFGLSILTSLLLAVPLSFLVTFKVPNAITRRLAQELSEPESSVIDPALRMAKNLGIVVLRLLQSPSSVPFAYSIGGTEGTIVISKGLVTRLDRDEVETVLVHEIAHIKNHDTRLSTIVAVYRRFLFFDPFMPFVERAVCGEKEFSADELSARETQKPLSLASALLKISSANPIDKSHMNVKGLSILGSSRVLSPPSVKERIERLLKIADELEQASRSKSSNYDRLPADVLNSSLESL